MGSHWSPSYAMKAYMHTLRLCKDYHNDEVPVEPKCMEFISALAAGNQARLLVDVAPAGMSSSTLALAIAARQTGGRLVCIRDDDKGLEEARDGIDSFGLGDVVEFRAGDPCELIKAWKNIDFAVVDQRIENCVEVFLRMDMDPGGSVVLVSNLQFRGRKTRANSYAQTVLMSGKGLRSESAVLPIGNGIEVTRIGKCRRIRPERVVVSSPKRTFVVHEEY